MKSIKTIALIVVFSFILYGSCLAETSLIQFMDTYWFMRNEICKDTGSEISFLAVPHKVEKIENERKNGFSITGEPGHIFVHPDSLRVDSLFFNFYGFNTSEDAAFRDLVKVLSIISALEYDVSTMSIEAIVDGIPFDYDTIYNQAFNIYDNIMMTTFIENFEQLERGEDVILYEGEYRYTAWGFDSYSDNEYIYVLAEVIE